MSYKYTFIGNWKMYLSSREEEKFLKKNKDVLANLASSDNRNIVLCPSFLSLQKAVSILSDTEISIGAQTCSSKEAGASTGDIAASALKEIGIKYCIVGHSERRQHAHETSADGAKKITQLVKNKIQPIICIGETELERKKREASSRLTEQLTPAIEAMHAGASTPFLVAYEPVWAIGTGFLPTADELQKTISWIHAFIQAELPGQNYTVLYGGSVTDSTLKGIRGIQGLQGFLIGRASVDFQALKKIVRSWYTSL